MSNRFYSVHPRRNDRFVAPSKLLQTIYRDVDFSEYDFTKHMLSQLAVVSPERFDLVRQELKQSWVSRMKVLLKQFEGKTVLLWFAPHSPEQDESAQEFGTDPMFVSRDMIEDVRSVVTEVVEVVASPAAVAMGSEGMVFTEMEAPAAAQIMGPAAHEEAAAALGEVVVRLHK